MCFVITKGAAANSIEDSGCDRDTDRACRHKFNSIESPAFPSWPHQGAHATYRLFTQSAGQDSQAHGKSA